MPNDTSTATTLQASSQEGCARQENGGLLFGHFNKPQKECRSAAPSGEIQFLLPLFVITERALHICVEVFNTESSQWAKGNGPLSFKLVTCYEIT